MNPLLLFIMISEILLNTTVESKTYVVKKIEKEIITTGEGTSPLWKSATELTDFIYPWENDTPPLMSFQALHSKDWIYLLYKVEDKNIQVYVNTNDKSEVVHSDRVEIFFRRDEKMSPYYGLELDPNGRVLDYEATYQRNFNDKWTWPKGQLIVKASRIKDGYIVEVAISKQSLKQLELLKNNSLEAGIYRGECLKINLENDSDIKWISWVKPLSKTPDFHIPSSFGVLLLED